jgi:hypothetical protein
MVGGEHFQLVDGNNPHTVRLVNSLFIRSFVGILLYFVSPPDRWSRDHHIVRHSTHCRRRR